MSRLFGKLMAHTTRRPDVAARRARVPALDTESDTRYRTLLEAAPDAIVVVDEAGRIVVVNRQAERTFGYSRDQLVGQEVEILLPERVRAAHRERRVSFAGSPRLRAMSGGSTFVARRADGSEMPVEIALSPHGQLVTAIVRDVTQRRRAEQEQKFLAEACAALAASLDLAASLGRLASLAVEAVADVCVVVRPRGGVIAATAVQAGDVELSGRIRELLERWPLRPDPRSDLWQRLQVGEPVLIEQVRDPLLRKLAQSDQHLAALLSIGVRSALAVPLRAQGRPFGTVLLGRSAASYDAEHLAWVDSVVGQGSTFSFALPVSEEVPCLRTS